MSQGGEGNSFAQHYTAAPYRGESPSMARLRNWACDEPLSSLSTAVLYTGPKSRSEMSCMQSRICLRQQGRKRTILIRGLPSRNTPDFRLGTRLLEMKLVVLGLRSSQALLRLSSCACEVGGSVCVRVLGMFFCAGPVPLFRLLLLAGWSREVGNVSRRW